MNRRQEPSWSERLYAALVRLAFPPTFRARFGDDMRDLFRDRYYQARESKGLAGISSLWSHTLVDLASAGVRERIAEISENNRRERIAAVSSDTPFPHRTVSFPRALLSDARFALRVFAKNPAFVFTAVLVVALGTGAVSTIFSVANAIVLRPIPGVRDASEIVEIGRTRPGGGGTLSASYPYYRHLA
ncbi:MAG: hypothetical protein ABIT38_21985, partial [Gemmatimonadaceae bacterium]